MYTICISMRMLYTTIYNAWDAFVPSNFQLNTSQYSYFLARGNTLVGFSI